MDNYKEEILSQCRLSSNTIRNTARYQAWKRQVRKRDRDKCRHCGRKEKLIVHHKDELVMILGRNKISTLEQAHKCGRLWRLKNGLTLCKPCHKKLHRKSKKEYLKKKRRWK